MPRKVRVSLKEIKGTLLYDDKNFNIKLVKEVEKYPCLYNTSIPEYYRRDLLDQAWENVGKALNEDRYFLRERWTNLRRVLGMKTTEALSRSNGVLETTKKIPYYLFEEMKFVMPYLKNFIFCPETGRITHNPESNKPASTKRRRRRTKAATTVEDRELSEATYLEENKKRKRDLNEINEALVFLEATNQLIPFGNINESIGQVSDAGVVELDDSAVAGFADRGHASQTAILKQSKKQKSVVTQVSAATDNHRKSQSGDDHKKLFLMSLLPELCAMNEDQMKQFRRKAFQIIDGLLDPKAAFVQSASSKEYVATPIIVTLVDQDHIVPNQSA